MEVYESDGGRRGADGGEDRGTEVGEDFWRAREEVEDPA